MKKRTFITPEATYVETPNGLFTAAGVWFRTTEEAVRRYAAPVLEREPLPRLLAHAEAWLRSPETLTVWLFPVFLLLIDPLPAALAGVTFYAGWKTLGPSLTSRTAVPVLHLLDNVLIQGLYYVFTLSILAGKGSYIAVWVGLGAFILIRWGLLARAVEPIVRPAWRSLYALPVPDQILRGFLLRVAMRHRISLPQLDDLERQIISNTKSDR